ncbi:Centromere protein J [Larimichthys crocea]|uniref:Centromere protein J n=1 Tax=Larimichthys crocea TaxID=215358 RepID=A0A6G0I5I7_LARCR|nr:Centromere protein J [Larimichthys crocea]
MSAEIPVQRTDRRTRVDSDQSPGPAVVEHQEDRPMYLHCLLSPDGVISIGQHQDAEAVNTVTQSTQHVLDHPHEVVQQQIEQIHQVLQEQSRLLTLLGRGLTFPACVPTWWIGMTPVLTHKQPVFPESSPPPDRRMPEKQPVLTCPGQDSLTTEQRHFSTITETDQTVHRDGDQDPDSPANPEDRSAVVTNQPLGECVEEQLEAHELSEPKELQNLSGTMTKRCYFLLEGELVSKIDSNDLKITEQQEVQGRASLSQQQPSRKLTSGIQRSSSAPSMVFKDEGTQLETFQLLTFQSEHGRENFCSASCNPQTPQYSQRNTQTEIQAVGRSQEQPQPHLPQPDTAPFQITPIADLSITEGEENVCQLHERNKSKVKSHLDKDESSDNLHSERRNAELINHSSSRRPLFACLSERKGLQDFHSESKPEENYATKIQQLKEDQRLGSGLRSQEESNRDDVSSAEPQLFLKTSGAESRTKHLRNHSEETRNQEHLTSSDCRWLADRGGQKMLQVNSLKPQSDVTKMAPTSWGFHREQVDQKRCRDSILSDRDERQTMRGQHSLHKVGSGDVQVLRQQVEALQQQFKQRESDWSVVRCQLDELMRENSELRKKLTITPQCCPVVGRCTAQTHTVNQEGQTQVEPRLSHGCTLVDNGTRTGMSKTVTLFNGDIKHVLEDGKVVYYYAGSQITQTTYPSGLVVLHFPNKQIEKRHPGGKREILFPDQTIKYLEPDGSERTIFPDGTIVHLSP